MMETTADALRRWVKAQKAMDAAGWSMQDATTYLRGHDDRQPEIDALTARVRELEATVLDEHSRLAQEEVARFLAILGNRLAPAPTADLAKTAVELMLPFFGLLRVKAVLEAFAGHRKFRPPE